MHILLIDIGRGGGGGDDQKVVASGYPRQNNRNMIMLGGNQIISATTLCMWSAWTSFLFCSEFTSKIQQPIRKCAIRVYIAGNWYRTGMGLGLIGKYWLLGIPDITIKITVFWKKLEYLSYITMCVNCWNPFLCFFLDFTSKIQQPMRKCAIRVYV